MIRTVAIKTAAEAWSKLPYDRIKSKSQPENLGFSGFFCIISMYMLGALCLCAAYAALYCLPGHIDRGWNVVYISD
ncbi:hypothetical protein D3C79_1017040 [compost metagenome]